jgi:hypothetical protein
LNRRGVTNLELKKIQKKKKNAPTNGLNVDETPSKVG